RRVLFRSVLRTLPFVAVRQEQRQSAQSSPLRFARADELIDDDLRAVREVPELRFPDRETVGLRRGKAVLETEHRLFGQERIDDGKARLARRDVLEGNVRSEEHTSELQ